MLSVAASVALFMLQFGSQRHKDPVVFAEDPPSAILGLFVCGPSSRRTPFSRTLPVFTGPQKSKVQVSSDNGCPI
ncbi:hypothetical protein INR49_006373 [Caranx melampygus]|nr:hypothetical protein INR49_006373 [Caranx melampygus]